MLDDISVEVGCGGISMAGTNCAAVNISGYVQATSRRSQAQHLGFSSVH